MPKDFEEVWREEEKRLRATYEDTLYQAREVFRQSCDAAWARLMKETAYVCTD